MSKEFIRDINNVDDINKLDFETNDVNDIISDNNHTYIHRLKNQGKDEEYHNLTDNIKTIENGSSDLLRVTNYNKSKNTAKLEVLHDNTKEQRLESDDSIIIVASENATTDKTTITVNEEEVLYHKNLTVTNPIEKSIDGKVLTLKLSDDFIQNINKNSEYVQIVNVSTSEVDKSLFTTYECNYKKYTATNGFEVHDIRAYFKATIGYGNYPQILVALGNGLQSLLHTSLDSANTHLLEIKLNGYNSNDSNGLTKTWYYTFGKSAPTINDLTNFLMGTIGKLFSTYTNNFGGTFEFICDCKQLGQ